jgi:hypothetical protein
VDLNSEFHRRRLFYSEHDRPAFQPYEQAMFEARYYQILEARRQSDRCLLIVDPVCDFDFVADQFSPFLDRVFTVLGLVYPVFGEIPHPPCGGDVEPGDRPTEGNNQPSLPPA